MFKNHYKDPYEPTSKMESKSFFSSGSFSVQVEKQKHPQFWKTDHGLKCFFGVVERCHSWWEKKLVVVKDLSCLKRRF